MRTTQQGDRVQVHYAIRSQNGSEASSRGREPLELTVGVDHPRLPGLGSALVGLTPGEGVALIVPPERAHGPHDPARVRRWPRGRFPEDATLQPGKRVRYTDGGGRSRLVRILHVSKEAVVVDANRRWAGQTLEVEVELVGILTPSPEGGQPPRRGRAVAFDLDAASLASLRSAFPGWQIDSITGASAASLAPSWDAGAADLLLVGVRANATDTLRLCRFLASLPRSGDSWHGFAEARKPHRPLDDPERREAAPLLVLVPPGQDTFVGAALEAGAHCCLLLPISPVELTRMTARAQASSRPGRHTLNLERAQGEAGWRDDGGEG